MEKIILLGHGSGGRLMHSLIKGILVKKLGNPVLKQLTDSAFIKYKENLAFTTDSFVVSPLFFPGADIGKLSVCGVINDLVMMAAVPEYLSLGLILEEGLEISALEKIIDSIARQADNAGVKVVTGDLKVVPRGACDKVFINASGIGRILPKRKFSIDRISTGDRIIVTGGIGEHGIAVLSARQEFGFSIKSDCLALNKLLIPIIKKYKGIKFMRDPTRGGIATTLNEISEGCKLGIEVEEKNIPVLPKVKTACELLGIDPLYVACEGRALIVVAPDEAEKVLSALRRRSEAKNARIIATVTGNFKNKVVLDTSVGSRRVIDMLISEALPRIC